MSSCTLHAYSQLDAEHRILLQKCGVMDAYLSSASTSDNPERPKLSIRRMAFRLAEFGAQFIAHGGKAGRNNGESI
jgi:hypothetical protein